jgi:phosphoribosylformylglycinamidine cyclo-ligase
LSDAARGKKRTYAAAGVDIDAATRAVERIREVARGASRPEVLAGVGPFGSLFQLPSYRDPVLVASVDGVGTKVKLAPLLGRFDTVGVDIVNHCINDIFTCGAEPLFFLDYIASSTLGEDEKVTLVQGMASACCAVGCALVGGELADMPDIYAPGDFDLVGFVVGAVERDAVIDGSAIREGDALLGLPSSGLHTNGYSLVRKIFRVGVGGDPEQERAALERSYPSLGTTLGEALLAPHRCYYNQLRPVLPHLRGIAHITGGGLIDNVPRVLPEGLAARFERESWEVPPIFSLIETEGKVERGEMYRTFNMGLGIVVVCSPESAEVVRSQVPEARAVGQVVRQRGRRRVILP